MSGERLIETGSLDISTTFEARLVNGSSAFVKQASSRFLEETTNPLGQILLGLGFGVDPRRGGDEISGYLDPRYAAYFQLNPSMWEAFKGFISLKPVYRGEPQWRADAGTYQGAQWRIERESIPAWTMLRSASLLIGTDRTIRDNAPLLYAILSQFAEDNPDTILDIRMRPEFTDVKALDLILQQLGVITPIKTYSPDEQVWMNQRAISQSFRYWED